MFFTVISIFSNMKPSFLFLILAMIENQIKSDFR
jgi:hypothetical protein